MEIQESVVHPIPLLLCVNQAQLHSNRLCRYHPSVKKEMQFEVYNSIFLDIISNLSTYSSPDSFSPNFYKGISTAIKTGSNFFRPLCDASTNIKASSTLTECFILFGSKNLGIVAKYCSMN